MTPPVLPIQIMFCCDCPEPLPAPTPHFQTLRQYCKFMGIGLSVIAFLNFLIGNIFEVFVLGLFMYNLYLGYSRFDYCSMLVFLIYCVMQSVFYLLLVVDKISNPPFFGQYPIAGVYILICWVYFTVSVFVSHYVYKHYKALVVEAQQSGYGMMGASQRMYEMQAAGSGRFQAGQQNAQQAQNQPRSYFHGQGVTIG